MTLPYHATARLNATPLSRHFEAAEAPELPKTADELLAAMRESARESNAQMKRDANWSSGVPLTDADVIELVSRKPGHHSGELARMLRRKTATVYARLKRLVDDGVLRDQPGKYGARMYYINDGRKKLDAQDETIKFIRENPGASVFELQKRFGLTKQATFNRISRIRQKAATYGVRIVTVNAKRGGVAAYRIEDIA